MSDPTAVMGRRTLAAIIDSLLAFALYLLLFFSFAESSDRACTFADQRENFGGCVELGDTTYRLEGGDAVLANLLSFAYSVGVFMVLQGLTGATPGKLIGGVRVVDEEGRPPGMARAVGRSLLWIVDAAPWCVPGVVAFITALTTTGHRRVGDMACKTYVVGTASVGAPIVVPQVPAAGSGEWVAVGDTQGRPPPQWDEARKTWIQWLPDQQAWFQWDDDRRDWIPIR